MPLVNVYSQRHVIWSQCIVRCAFFDPHILCDVILFVYWYKKMCTDMALLASHGMTIFCKRCQIMCSDHGDDTLYT